jgi:DNA-binding NarL/FixJ family response regulator
MNSIRMIFIDKQRMFVQGMISLINKSKYPDIKILGQYEKTDEFVKYFDGEADIVVIDIQLTDNEGVDFITKIKKQYKNIKVVVLTTLTDYKFVKQSMTNGADGYLLKTSDFSEFEFCIIEVMENKTFMGNGVHLSPPASIFKNSFKPSDKTQRFEDRYQIRQKLTKREQEILRLITQAKTNDEIGDLLFISDQTVGVHRKNIMRKLGMKSTMTLIKYAIENELV